MLLRIAILSAALLICPATPGSAYENTQDDDWTATDWSMLAVYFTMHGMDWAQTLHIARDPKNHIEANGLLGPHPSEGRVNSYFAATLAGYVGVSYLLPNPYRSVWQGTWIHIMYNNVQNNRTHGIGISLHF